MAYSNNDPSSPSYREQTWRSKWGLAIIGLIVTVILLLIAILGGGPYGPFVAGALGCLIVVPAIVSTVATFWVIATKRAVGSGEPPREIVARVVSPVNMVSGSREETSGSKEG